jgi:hypothetical protein
MPRFPESLRRPAQILGTNQGTLHTLYAHVQALLDLQGVIRAVVPGDVYVASCDAAVIHLITPSPALATRLRYGHRKLIAALRDKAGIDLQQVKVSVRPNYVPPQPRLRPAKPLSPENARHLASTAKYIEDDSLRIALIRLSDRASKP